MFEGLSLEQHWRPPWLLPKLVMPRKGAKLPSNKAEASKVAAVTTCTADDDAAALLKETPMVRLMEDSVASPCSHKDTPDGDVRSIELDQNGY